MYERAQLEKMPADQLKALARSLNVPSYDSLPPETLISEILGANNEQSGFINSGTSEDHSGFITNEEEMSGFITSDEGLLDSISEESGSGFIVSNDASGFINESDTSGFILNEPSTEILPKKSQAHQLGKGDDITLNQKPYTITDIISQSSGEAIIYKIQDTNQREYALKLYREVSNKKREPNAIALERIRKIDHAEILKLHDFGTEDQKYKGKYCFEISTFAEGGDLLSVEGFQNKYSYSFILNTIIPQVFGGIKKLHRAKIYHCDLKPQNVFFLDKAHQDLVIGDYGSAKTFNHGYEQEHKSYSEVIGTKTYVAPEQANGIISEKIDYYAFGMILLHLLYPEAMTKDENPKHIDRQKMHKIKERQYEQVSIYQFKPEYRKVNQLIEGLTLYDHKSRWGEEEVEKWLNGHHVSVSYHAQAVIKPVKLGWITIRMPEDLIQAVEEYPAKKWYVDLIHDSINFRELMIWLNNLRDAQYRKSFQQMLMYYQNEEASEVSKNERIPYIKEAIIRFFDPYRPLNLIGETFDFIHGEDILEEVRRFFRTFDQVWKNTELNKLRFTLFKFEFALRQAEVLSSGERKEIIRSILDTISERLGQKAFPAFNLYHTDLQKVFIADEKKELTFFKNILYLLYAFIPERGFRSRNGESAHNLEELGLFFAQNQGQFGDKVVQLEKGFFLNNLQKYPLHKKGYENFLFEVFREKITTHFELESIKMESDRNVVFQYKYYKTLGDYFKSKNIDNQLIRAQTGNETYVVKKGIFQGANKVFNEFLLGIKRQHNISDEVLTAEKRTALKKQVKKELWKQGLILHTGEWFGALILLIPFLGGASVAFLKSPDGISVAEQLFKGLSLNNYTFDPELYYNTVKGFYVIGAFFLITYLLSLTPRLWCGNKLALIGTKDPKEPDLLSLDTKEGMLLIIMMILAPTVFSFANWLYEPIGWVLILVFGGVLTFATGEKRARILGIFVILAGILRIAYMVQIGFDFDKWEFYGRQNRGWIDLILYLTMFFLAFIPAIVYQLFKAHSTFYFSLKVLAMALLIGGLGLFNLGIGRIGAQNWAYTVPGFERFAEKQSDTDLIPGKYIGVIKDGLEWANVRSGPTSQDDNIIMQMPKGERFIVEKEGDEGWWIIERSDGTRGYMHSSVLEIIRQAIVQDIIR